MYHTVDFTLVPESVWINHRRITYSNSQTKYSISASEQSPNANLPNYASSYFLYFQTSIISVYTQSHELDPRISPHVYIITDLCAHRFATFSKSKWALTCLMMWYWLSQVLNWFTASSTPVRCQASWTRSTSRGYTISYDQLLSVRYSDTLFNVSSIFCCRGA